MEFTVVSCIVGIVGVMLVLCAWRVLNWIWFKPKKIEKCLREQGLKGSSYNFFVGDLKEMVELMVQAQSNPIKLTDDIVHRVLPFAHKSVTTYGKICFTWAGLRPIVQISEPSMVKEILCDVKNFHKPKVENPLVKLLVRGLADVNGDQWVKHRKIINPAFHVEKLKHMVPSMYVSCCEMINKWEEMLTNESSCEVDVWPHLQTFSGDVISRTAFGTSYEEGRKIFQLQQELAELVVKANQSIYIPGSRFLPTKSNKRMKETEQEMRALLRNIIYKRITMMKSEGTHNNDLLGILLSSSDQEIKEHGNSRFGLSIDDIIEECKIFYLAGQETTAVLLVWTMVLLSSYMKWQARARQEVLDIFGDKKPNIEGLSRLKIMNMILNEVLRLYPSVVVIGRQVHEETKVGNITLRAGTHIQLNNLLMHNDQDLWGEDAKEFNPDRFSEGIVKATKGQSSYFPFGGGPRICIGQNFAMLETKMALVMILQRFSFELSPSYSHAPRMILTLQPQFGAHLIIHKL
ncbi:hypothetical protein L1987_16083 [Smallanthus sonchifolius]|uniref:Uncharacterized protein n=1 Tax=Smallanthus sonchifolius TaxID=185202 RepID=A0ACB9J7W2_9ASTR|nr:hypothetical protein L1987_16083 [Smallanthus sonchifolius]